MPSKRTFRTAFVLVITLLFFSTSSNPVLQVSTTLAQTTQPEPIEAGAGFNVIFAPETSDAYVAQTYTALTANPDLSPFRLATHWTPASTALNSGGSAQGDAVALTWSIIPDGTSMPAQSVDDTTCNSNLIATMNATYGNGPWQAEIAEVFAEWATNTANTYVQVSDDGAAWPNSPGVTGLRGDVRIGGCTIDGNFGILAYNFFPSNGDMKIDATDSFYTADILNDGFHNVIAHEHGHGDGLQHVCPVNETKLMEPFVSFAFTGLQHDDIRGGQRQYGDTREIVSNPNDSAAAASNLGTPTLGVPVNTTGVSIDDNGDQDWFRFTVAASTQLNASVSPVGSTYLEGPQNGDGSCTAGTNLNSLAIHNLGFEVRDSNGTTVLATGNTNGVGLAETLSNIALGAAGTKYIRVFGDATDNIQLYTLQLTVNGGATATSTSTPTPTNTGTALPTSTATNTPTPTNTGTALPTSTATNTPTPTNTGTALPTSTATNTPTPTNTGTALPTSTATNTPTPTNTGTALPTSTATNTPTPTNTPTGANATIMISSDANGKVPGLNYRDEDIIAYNSSTGLWSLVFDGSDVGLGNADIDGFAFLPNGHLLLSVEKDFTLNGFGAVDDADILRFIPVGYGPATAGSYFIYFDGSDVGLNSSDEDVDAIDFDAAGNLLISVNGSFKAQNVTGNDEDLFVLTGFTPGANTVGTWGFYFDGSDISLTSSGEDIFGLWADHANSKLYLATSDSFLVPGASGDEEDILVCRYTSLGTNTACTFSLFWHGETFGFDDAAIDGLAIGNLPTVVSSADGIGSVAVDDTVEAAGDDVNEPNPLDGEEVEDETMIQRFFLPIVVQ